MMDIFSIQTIKKYSTKSDTAFFNRYKDKKEEAKHLQNKEEILDILWDYPAKAVFFCLISEFKKRDKIDLLAEKRAEKQKEENIYIEKITEIRIAKDKYTWNGFNQKEEWLALYEEQQNTQTEISRLISEIELLDGVSAIYCGNMFSSYLNKARAILGDENVNYIPKYMIDGMRRCLAIEFPDTVDLFLNLLLHEQHIDKYVEQIRRSKVKIKYFQSKTANSFLTLLLEKRLYESARTFMKLLDFSTRRTTVFFENQEYLENRIRLSKDFALLETYEEILSLQNQGERNVRLIDWEKVKEKYAPSFNDIITYVLKLQKGEDIKSINIDINYSETLIIETANYIEKTANTEPQNLFFILRKIEKINIFFYTKPFRNTVYGYFRKNNYKSQIDFFELAKYCSPNRLAYIYFNTHFRFLVDVTDFIRFISQNTNNIKEIFKYYPIWCESVYFPSISVFNLVCAPQSVCHKYTNSDINKYLYSIANNVTTIEDYYPYFFITSDEWGRSNSHDQYYNNLKRKNKGYDVNVSKVDSKKIYIDIVKRTSKKPEKYFPNILEWLNTIIKEKTYVEYSYIPTYAVSYKRKYKYRHYIFMDRILQILYLLDRENANLFLEALISGPITNRINPTPFIRGWDGVNDDVLEAFHKKYVQKRLKKKANKLFNKYREKDKTFLIKIYFHTCMRLIIPLENLYDTVGDLLMTTKNYPAALYPYYYIPVHTTDNLHLFTTNYNQSMVKCDSLFYYDRIINSNDQTIFFARINNYNPAKQLFVVEEIIPFNKIKNDPWIVFMKQFNDSLKPLKSGQYIKFGDIDFNSDQLLYIATKISPHIIEAMKDKNKMDAFKETISVIFKKNPFANDIDSESKDRISKDAALTETGQHYLELINGNNYKDANEIFYKTHLQYVCNPDRVKKKINYFKKHAKSRA